MRHARRFGPLVLMLMLATLLLKAGPVLAASETVVVSPPDMQGWVFAQEIATGSGELVNGPTGAPLGTGSAKLTVDATGRELLLNPSYAGTRFADVTELKYSSYSEGTSPVLAPSLQFDVDYDLTDANGNWQGRLVFEPYMSYTVVPQTWQTWDALAGKWWASGAPGNTVCPQHAPCTWAQVLSAFPNAGVRTTAPATNVQFKVGGPWAPGYTGYVDALALGVSGDTDVYDFEYYTHPATKDECKKGGWKEFNPNRPEGPFKNQGDCVSWVNTHGS